MFVLEVSLTGQRSVSKSTGSIPKYLQIFSLLTFIDLNDPKRLSYQNDVLCRYLKNASKLEQLNACVYIQRDIRCNSKEIYGPRLTGVTDRAVT